LETLRRIRTMRGMNQVELARASGVAQNTISEIETGRREARPATLRKLADALGVEIADFFGEPTYPKEQAPPDPQRSFNNLLEEERRLSYLSAWRAYVWKLIMRWENEPPKTPSEVSVVLDAMQALIDEGVFQRPPDELTTSDKGELGEWFELNQLFRGLDRLNRIAEDVEADTEAERRRAAFQQIQGQMAG
jgi:transcriptional regulator with XRE-family HTH domain